MSDSVVGIDGIGIACRTSSRFNGAIYRQNKYSEELTTKHRNQCNSIRSRDFATRSHDLHRLIRRDFRRRSGNFQSELTRAPIPKQKLRRRENPQEKWTPDSPEQKLLLFNAEATMPRKKKVGPGANAQT